MSRTSTALVPLRHLPGTITWWAERDVAFEVTTHAAARKVRQRDLQRFAKCMRVEDQTDRRRDWTPCLSKAFDKSLPRVTVNGRRSWSDPTIHRILSPVKTFARWIPTRRPVPLGHPVDTRTLQPPDMGLEIEWALTASERRQQLNAADLLVESGGRSTDRHRHRGITRPKRQGYRALWNQAISDTLVETGMRHAAVLMPWTSRSIS